MSTEFLQTRTLLLHLHTGTNTQMRLQQRQHALNFYMTAGQSHARNIPAQHTMLSCSPPPWRRDSCWVFKLRGAVTLLTQSNMPYTFTQSVTCGSAEMVSVRWCHRIGMTACATDSPASLHDNAIKVDPLLAAFGMDSLIWARTDEADEPYQMAQLRKEMGKLLTPAHNSDAAVQKARTWFDSMYSDRFPSDDAYSGHAYCDLQDMNIRAMPIGVQPVWTTERRSTPWAPQPVDHVDSTEFSGFTTSQAYQLSAFSQLRMNLFHMTRAQRST
jgi:hypothetical protein